MPALNATHRCAVFALLALLLLLAVSSVSAAPINNNNNMADSSAIDAPPHPPAWPTYFYANYTVFYQPYGPYWQSAGGGEVFYDHSLPAMRSSYKQWCAPMFENPTAYNFTCEFLFVNDTAYYLNNGDPSHPPCCVFMTPFAPPKPDFFGDAKYAGETVMHAQNTTIWHKEGFGYLSYDVYGKPSDSYYPASLWGPLADGYLEIDYAWFDASVRPDPVHFAVPAQCQSSPACEDFASFSSVRLQLPLAGHVKYERV
ncbi:hypothetical protein CAOG_06577 [Capsaspora owczarzaki ATCC 30864]|uniref:Uncharacterized protein n=1 Tax=Capsaspora owczarzaki (strain ATCC 30864) TaxID=595528 RepID=A0A0D2VX79_CAPO3|nr:hypothetical protein CAOG_06577 [Capsaspora owczarzaki ATCC 30864]KJE96222.1 hypothetical protein CAOG_006577 [Capsaspora owczarzaki ATCC 30864]|eukprot:XP_004345326.1 hypothetical protein CAOG_06577 [Capsaspora owczarzaki ATCC 30864]